MDLCNRSDIQALLARHGFHFSKSMGQNFLIESWVPAQIADASGADAGMGVLEIGPGSGPLTQQLAQRSTGGCCRCWRRRWRASTTSRSLRATR